MNDRLLSPLFTWRSAVASKESRLSPTQRHVALTLSLHMSEKGDSCFPSMARLVDETGLGLSTVRRMMQQLHEAGWLDRQVNASGLGTNRYRAMIPESYQVEEPRPQRAGSADEPRPQQAGTPPAAGAKDVNEDDKEQPLAPQAARARPARKPDPVWDALVELFGPVVDKTNAHAKRNKAVGDLRKLGASADAIDAAMRAWPRLFGDAALTDVALATHYPQLLKAAGWKDGQPTRRKPCDECGVGGGMHAAGCSKAEAAA